MKLRHLLSTLLLAALSSFAFSADNLVVNVDEANSPFMYSKGGKAAGIYPGLIESAFKHMNVPVSVETKPWKRAIQEIDEGQAGVGGIYKNAEREKKYDYSDQIFLEKLVIYFNKAHPVNFKEIGDLKGKKVGVLRGWSYGDDFDNARKANELTAEEVASDDQNFQKLDQGHLDAVVAINESGNALLPKFKSIGYAANPLSQNPTYLTFAKSANKTAVLKQFDQAIKDMKKSGEFQKIVAAELASAK
jgi:polar amino acid transport system substrate-binding protein